MNPPRDIALVGLFFFTLVLEESHAFCCCACHSLRTQTRRLLSVVMERYILLWSIISIVFVTWHNLWDHESGTYHQKVIKVDRIKEKKKKKKRGQKRGKVVECWKGNALPEKKRKNRSEWGVQCTRCVINWSSAILAVLCLHKHIHKNIVSTLSPFIWNLTFCAGEDVSHWVLGIDGTKQLCCLMVEQPYIMINSDINFYGYVFCDWGRLYPTPTTVKQRTCQRLYYLLNIKAISIW